MARTLGHRLTRLEEESALAKPRASFEDIAITEAWVRRVLSEPQDNPHERDRLGSLSSKPMPEGDTTRWLVAWGASLEAKTK